MKNLSLMLGILIVPLILCAETYTGSRFGTVWSEIEKDPYETLPHYNISLASLFGWFKNKISDAANRTLSDRSDILPPFRKLVHANGICFKGTWQITEENSYGGYFKNGSRGLIIARASVAFSDTEKGNNRAFGFAGKIFPTLDENSKVETANFFTINDLGGTKDDHFTDTTLSNAPPTSINATVIEHLAFVMKVAKAFKKADSDPNIRQVYEISELGEENLNNIRTPKWMAVRAMPDQTVDEADFRDELNISKRNKPLLFQVLVADEVDAKEQRLWKQIGLINLEASIVSDGCDHRLHFHHPKTKVRS